MLQTDYRQCTAGKSMPAGAIIPRWARTTPFPQTPRINTDKGASSLLGCAVVLRRACPRSAARRARSRYARLRNPPDGAVVPPGLPGTMARKVCWKLRSTVSPASPYPCRGTPTTLPTAGPSRRYSARWLRHRGTQLHRCCGPTASAMFLRVGVTLSASPPA